MSCRFAVLFAKPHIAHSDHALCLPNAYFSRLRIKVVEMRWVRLNRELLTLNYLPHAFFASRPFRSHVHHLGPSTRRLLESHTRFSVRSHLLNHSLLSATEAVRQRGFTPRRLLLAWRDIQTVARIGPGYQIKLIQDAACRPFWVVNGYFPYRFQQYATITPFIPVWLLSLPSGMSVSEARNRLLGDGSRKGGGLRNYLALNEKTIGIHMDDFNNGFHMSDTEASSFRETALWFPQQLPNYAAIAQSLATDQVSLRRIASRILSVDASISLSCCTTTAHLERTITRLLSNIHLV